jgi:hypothetical protein
MTTIAGIARRLRISERAAAREVDAAIAREFMHRQLVERGLDRSRKNHRLVVRKADGSPGSLRPPRRFPDVLIHDRGHDSPAVWIAPARSRSRGASHLPPKEPSTVQLTITPSALTNEYERLPLGDRDAELLYSEAAAAIAADRVAAVAAIFQADVVAADANTLSLYTWHTSRYDRPGFGDRMAALYRRAMTSAPELCKLLLSPEAIADVEAAAAALAAPSVPQQTYAEAGAAAAAAARRRYESEIAALLAEAGGELARSARRSLELEALSARVEAARQRHEQAAAVAAEQAERERRAAQDADDRAQDAAEVERKLDELLRTHGLPAGLRTGIYIETNRERIELLVRARRRLQNASVDGIRINIGQGRGLYGCVQLSRGIADAPVDQLRMTLAELDRAEGKAVVS